MQQLSNSGYTETQVKAALHSSRTIKWEYVLLDKNDRNIGFISDITGSYGMDSEAEIKGSARFELSEKEYKNIIIKATLGISTNNYGISGSGYAVGSTNAISNRISTMVDAYLITVFAGTNDWGRTDVTIIPLGSFGDNSSTTFYGILDNVMNQLITKYPTKIIALITPTPRENDNLMNVNGNYLSQYSDAIIKVGHKYSIPVLDLYSTSNIYSIILHLR